MSVRIANIIRGNYTVTIVLADDGIGSSSPTNVARRVMSGFCREHVYRIGDVISDEDAAAIVSASRVSNAVEVGMRLLGYADSSIRMMSKKLRERGFDRETADAASRMLAEMGAIDEDAQIERRGLALAERRLRGKRRVAAELCALGYKRERVEAWLDVCGVDFSAICRRAIMEHGGVPSEPDGKCRLLSYLYRQGFSSDDVRHALR